MRLVEFTKLNRTEIRFKNNVTLLRYWGLKFDISGNIESTTLVNVNV